MGVFIVEDTLTVVFASSEVYRYGPAVLISRLMWLSQTQAAHAVVLVRSLQYKWSHFQRVILDCTHLFLPLLEALNDVFYPTLLDGPVYQHEV